MDAAAAETRAKLGRPTCGVATAVISGGRCEVIILACWHSC